MTDTHATSADAPGGAIDALAAVRNLCLDEVDPYIPGATSRYVSETFGVPRDSIIKLSSNEAPLGPAPEVRAALHLVADGDDVHRYPSSDQVELRSAIAATHGLEVAQVLADSGSSSTWPHVVRAFSEPGDSVVTVTPSMSSYKELSVLLGRRVNEVVSTYPFAVPAGPVIAAADPGTRAVFLSSPNNTTSRLVAREAVRDIAAALPCAVVVVDEHYIHASEGHEDLSALGLVGDLPNVVVTRSFSKMFGLAGVRVGFAAGHPWVIEQLAGFRGKWSVSVAAEVAARAALEATDHLRANVATTVVGRRYLLAELYDLAVEVVPEPAGGFLLFRPTEVSCEVAAKGLLAKGIMVRDDLLDGWIRVSVGTPLENQQFVAALRASLGSGN